MSMGDIMRGSSLIGFGFHHDPVEFSFELRNLRGHAVVCGCPSSGKTTDCQRIARQVKERGCPVLIIEPQKTDYVCWAAGQNELLPPEERWEIFMPGVNPDNEHGYKPFELGLFQAQLYDGGLIEPAWKEDYLAELLADALSLGGAGRPFVRRVLKGIRYQVAGGKPQEVPLGQEKPAGEYPTLEELERFLESTLMHNVLPREEQERLCRTMHERFERVLQGSLAGVLRALPSVNELGLFQKPCIVNLSAIPDARDKRLVMGLLLLAAGICDENSWLIGMVRDHRVGVPGLGRLVVLDDAHYLLSDELWEGQARGEGCNLPNTFDCLLQEVSHYGQGVLLSDSSPRLLGEDIVNHAEVKVCHCLTEPEDGAFMAGPLGLSQEKRAMLGALRFGEAVVRVGGLKPVLVDMAMEAGEGSG